MVKKKRQQSDPHEDDSSTESCDDKELNNSQGNGSLRDCQHVNKSVDPTKLRKVLKSTGLASETCTECEKMPAASNAASKYDEAFEYDRTLWLCLKCGTQLCGRAKNQHALKHYETPRSDSHALALNTTTFEIWCYSCDEEVNASARKKLLECVEFVKKLAQQPSPTTTLTSSNSVDAAAAAIGIHNLQNTILTTLQKMEPLLSEPAPPVSSSNHQQFATAVVVPSTSGPPPIPGIARRVVHPTAAATATVDSLPRVRGLTNLGNTCFFNAVLQCLAQTPYLLDVLKESAEPGEEFVLPGGTFQFKDGQEAALPPIKGTLSGWGGLTSSLAEALDELQSNGGVFTPQKLFQKLTTKCPQFRGGDQHDSHELLRHLLESVRSEDLQRYQKVILQNLGYKGQDINSVGDDMKQKCKIYGQQAADRILRPEQVFRGFLVSTLTCQDCYHISSRHENFLDMSLPVSVEKPQPPIRRKSSPEASPTSATVPSKHQIEKEREKQRKSHRAQKHHHSKRAATAATTQPSTSQNLMTTGIPGGPDGDNPTIVSQQNDGENNSNSRSSTSSSEQSDADVEDNLIDDMPRYVQYGNRTTPIVVDSNGNSQTLSPANPEKRDDSPENLNKDSNDDENDSGIATSPANTVVTFTEQAVRGVSSPTPMNCVDPTTTVAMPPNNLVLELGISERGANMVKQRTLSSDNDGGDLPTRQLEKLSLKDKETAASIAAKQKIRSRRSRTISYSDWSTTIAPRYQCEDGECSVQSCLNNFTAVELMTGNNKVGCDGCTKRVNGENGKTIYTNATKQFLISSPPAVLILHLKRFQVGPRGFRKLTRAVTFPLVLDIAPFCGSKVKNLPNIDRRQKKLLYGLYGIVEHSGGMYGGHYTAFVKVRPKFGQTDPRWKFLPQGSKAELDQTDVQKATLDNLLEKEKAREMRLKENDSDDYTSSSESSDIDAGGDEAEGAVGGSNEPDLTAMPSGKWYYVSDSHVKEVTEECVLKAQAYLLFYERIY